MVTNIFSVSLLMAIEKSIPSRVKLTGFFIFLKHILDRVIFNLYFCGVYFCIVFNVLLASFADKINSCNFCLFFIFPIWISWKLCTLWSIVSIFFPAEFCYFIAQKIHFSIKDFFSKYDQICRKLQIWLHLLKKSLIEKFIFCAVFGTLTHFFMSSFR